MDCYLTENGINQYAGQKNFNRCIFGHFVITWVQLLQKHRTAIPFEITSSCLYEKKL